MMMLLKISVLGKGKRSSNRKSGVQMEKNSFLKISIWRLQKRNTGLDKG